MRNLSFKVANYNVIQNQEVVEKKNSSTRGL